MEQIVYSIAMVAVFLLGGAGVWLVVARREHKRGALMIAAALVILGNVAIWTLPVAGQ